MIGFDKALQVSCNTFFYRVGYQLLGEVRQRPERRQRQGPAGLDGQGARLRRRDRHRPARRGHRPDRRPPAGSGPTTRRRRATTAGSRKEPGADFLHLLRPRVLRRGQRLPRLRRGQLRHRPGRHRRHPAAAGPRLRRAVQRRHALRAAGRQGGRGHRRHRPQALRAEGPGAAAGHEGVAALPRHRAARASRRRARWPGSSATSRSTRSTSAARRARRRSTASSRRRGSPPTTRTTSSR